MSTEQQLIYECSRKTADKQISNSEWINIWRDGIQLNRGDTVRLLGSFISEDGDSSDIQVLDNQSFTMEYTPYINVNTVRFEDEATAAKSHPSAYQMRFGDMGSPVYLTDAFGIEPPYYALNANPVYQSDVPTNDHNFAEQLTQPISDIFVDWYSAAGWYGLLSGAETNPFTLNAGYNYAVNDSAIKCGAYFQTNNRILPRPTVQSTTSTPVIDYLTPVETSNSLSDFNLKNLSMQYQIAHLCKLVYFPVFQGVYYDRATSNANPDAPTIETFADDDFLQVGNYVSSYFVSAASKHNTTTTSTYAYDAGTTFGEVQWKSGPRSVVGKILATEKAFVDVPDPLTGQTVSMEMQAVYIYDFVNPGSYKNQNDDILRPRHGSAQNENGYNLNRNDNRNAGVTYAAYPNGSSNNTVYPYNLSFMPKSSEVQRVGQEVYAQTDTPLAESQPINESMNLETNTSLSFLWSCRGTDMRPLSAESPSLTNGSQDKATSWVHVNTTLGAPLAITYFQPKEIGATTIDIYNISNQKIRTESELVLVSGNIKIKKIFNFPGYVRLELYTGLGEAITANQPGTYRPNEGGIYWYPRQYKVNITDFDKNTGTNQRAWTYDKVVPADYDNWGAIVKTNPENDNVESYTPSGTNIHRLYIPFTQQTADPFYKVRHFGSGDSLEIDQITRITSVTLGGAAINTMQPTGNPNTVGQVRKRQNFGISCGRYQAGDCINDDTASRPVPYGRTIADNWNTPYSGGHGVAPTNMLNQDQGNSYNDSVISIHIQQPLTGSHIYKQNTADVNTITAKLWQEDLIYIKKYKTEFKPKPGYYSYAQVAEDLNIQLHYNNQDYQQNIGNNTTVGLRQRARGVAPNVLNGNFVHTYLPEISYGFMPITEELLNQNLTDFKLNGITDFRTTYVNDYLKTSPYTNDVKGDSINDGSITLYFFPFNYDNAGVELVEDQSLQLFKLNGAKLIPASNVLAMSNQDPQAMQSNRGVDILNTMINVTGSTTKMEAYQAGVNYQTRTAFNNFTYGGCAKIFVGAVNPSFEIDQDIQRMVWKFLYTPYRPATDDTGTALSLVSGQAVPSAIIDSFGNGGVTDSLSGIHIGDLIAEQIDEAFYPIDFLGFKTVAEYPVTDSLYSTNSRLFWNTLGFNDTQLGEFKNHSPTLPFLYYSRNFIRNGMLYNTAELDISANASNPFYSYCSLWLPPLQFSVEVDSNEVIASRQPLTQNSPFYLIGSDFPGKHYYGNKGTKLPVMGVCSRQFTSFGFAFDLSESAIQWTIEQDVFLTSIHTKIYNNDMSIPLNLDDNSSIIYAITKGQYYKQPSQEDLQNSEQLMLQNTEPPIQYTPQTFIYPNPLNYEAPLFYDEDSDYDE